MGDVRRGIEGRFHKMKNSTARAKKIIKRVVLIIVIFAISLIWLMPMLWIISTSLRLPTQSFTLPPHFLPTEFYWSNYAKVFDILPVSYTHLQ